MRHPLRPMACGLALLALAGCTDTTPPADTVADARPPLDLALCQPNQGGFSSTIDHDFLPLAVGRAFALEGMIGADAVRADWKVLDATETVAGVVTRVVEESQSVNGARTAVIRHYLAQAADGTVCNFGQGVDLYVDGTITGHGGAWRADEGSNRPGIQMPTDPQIDMRWAREAAPGVAEGQTLVTGLGITITIGAGVFKDTLVTADFSPLQTGRRAQVHVRGVGLAIDGPLQRLAE